jgi:hypothetical protein
MTTHYIAKFDGVTFTRSTAGRAYTDMVITVYNIAEERRATETRARANFRRDLPYTMEVAAGMHPSHPIPASGFHPSHGMLNPDGTRSEKYAAYVAERAAYDADYIARSKAWIAVGEEGHVAKALADFDARRAKATNNSSDGKSFYCDCGWCGRPDLAEKLAARYSNSMILPTEVVASRPKKAKRS